jgi:hypothetical protein
MKKKTNLQKDGGEAVKPTRQHGPQKEKTQITIRVDQQLINEAYKQIQVDNTRITDIIERGIYLALVERNHQMPLWNRQVRFMVANATKEQQGVIRGLLIALAVPRLDRKSADRHSKAAPGFLHDCDRKYETLFRQQVEQVRWFLVEVCNKLPEADAALEYYSRYGKSAEEMAELSSL